MALWRDDRTVRDTQGNAVANASVYWVQQPANTSSVPPSPLIAVATSVSGSTSTSNNPQTTNGFGQCSAYMQGGVYTVVEVWNGKVQAVYLDQAIGIPQSQGTVSSISVTMPTDIFSVAGSPVTTTGTIAVTENTQTANSFWGGPSSGSASTPTFRSITAADLPGSVTSWHNIKTYGAGSSSSKAIVHSGTITSGANTLTISSSSPFLFSAGDVGKVIRVQGAGVNGQPLYTTISGYTSSTVVTLSALASTTVTTAGSIAWWTSGQDVADQAAIASAIAAASITGGTVYAPAGVYIYNSGFSNVSNAAFQGLFGDGQSQTFFIAASGGVTGTFLTVSNNLSGFVIGGPNFGFYVAGPANSNPVEYSQVVVTGTNICTFTVTNSVTVPVGEQIIIQGNRGTASPLNDVVLKVTSSSASTLVGTTTGSITTVSLTNGTFTDVGCCTLMWNGISIQCNVGAPGNSTIASRFTVSSVSIESFAGDGLQLYAPNYGYIDQISVQNCAGGINAQTWLATIGKFSDPAAWVLGRGCRLTGNYKFGLYIRDAAGVTIETVGASSNGVNMLIYNSQGLTINSPDLESAVNKSASWPGYCLELRGAAGTTVNSPYMLVSSGNAVTQTMLYIWSSSNGCVVTGMRDIVSSSGGVQPTYEFQLSSNSSDNTILNPQMKLNTAYLDQNGNNLIVINGILVNQLQVANTILQGTPNFGNSSAVTSANFALSGGFGATASFSFVTGTLASGNLQVLPAGGGYAANPTITFTYPVTEVFTVNPVATYSRFDANIAVTGVWQLTQKTTTSCTWTFIGTPAAGNLLGLEWFVRSKN